MQSLYDREYTEWLESTGRLKTSRDSIEVEQLKLTPEQMRRAFARASREIKRHPVWHDPKGQR